jgi:hypothetical protein
MTTLQWLRRHPRQWNVWVTNRVAQVQVITDSAQWRHVAGLENPADLPCQGVASKALADNGLWFHGTWWLLEEPKDWPQEETDKLSVECMEASCTTEVDVPVVAVALAVQEELRQNQRHVHGMSYLANPHRQSTHWSQVDPSVPPTMLLDHGGTGFRPCHALLVPSVSKGH